MADIKAADVAKLRKMTGAGMLDCKNALKETNGDFELATDILRKEYNELEVAVVGKAPLPTR